MAINNEARTPPSADQYTWPSVLCVLLPSNKPSAGANPICHRIRLTPASQEYTRGALYVTAPSVRIRSLTTALIKPEHGVWLICRGRFAFAAFADTSTFQISLFVGYNGNRVCLCVSVCVCVIISFLLAYFNSSLSWRHRVQFDYVYIHHYYAVFIYRLPSGSTRS